MIDMAIFALEGVGKVRRLDGSTWFVKSMPASTRKVTLWEIYGAFGFVIRIILYDLNYTIQILSSNHIKIKYHFLNYYEQY